MPSQNSAPFFSRQQNAPVDRPFSVNGRFNRLSYIAWYGLLHFIFMTMLLLLSLILGIFNVNSLAFNANHFNALTSLAGLGYWAILLLYIYFNFVIIIRRLHDRNHSGWLCLLLFIPVVNFFFALYLLFVSGDPNDNRYGHPRPSSGIEKLIAWLLILVSLLSILAIGSAISYFIGTGELENPSEIIQQGTAYF